jgi:hypothetical protein
MEDYPDDSSRDCGGRGPKIDENIGKHEIFTLIDTHHL